MSVIDDDNFFLLENRLDQASIICILEFLNRNEINNLASLIYRSDSTEIEKGFYNETYLDLKFGNCLMIYCWKDEFWEDYMNEKIMRINKLLRKSITPIEIFNDDDWNDGGNIRLKFIKYMWKRIGSENWRLIQKTRHDRKLYIHSLSDKLSKIAKLNKRFKTPECEGLIRERIEQACFIEEDSLSKYLKEPMIVDNLNESIQYEKWVSMGMNVGKTSLFMTISGVEFPFEYTPKVFDGYNAAVLVSCINKKGEERKVSFHFGFWDTVGNEEYDKLRPLGYPDTTIFTLNYAINDWSSLKQLAEHLLWESTLSEPNATFVVVSTKNDLKEECYWNSLLDPLLMEEAISPEDGIMFTKSIGAISFIETSSKTKKGIEYLLQKLVLLRLIHLQHLKSIEKQKQDDTKRKCSVQ
ncbi:rho family small GTPase [Naegleria gruberi]|uniref:Rho family small GTPase n=1 Tax=Naegleria gruberi TaxID=5762 RepID=D2VHJ4_NAEGR|nr:rho family small GTPase [Naegleria gruberi]EFC43598.1 rho family small GTPase [Naegleria gruberi]|eukprot:XP_002676342.1 rho family small GTPase [Naegleria gruberi strain NEG-M]